MTPAAVVLDFYDDPTGLGLKRIYPTLESLPESIKVAHILSPEERAILRDEAYAVILQDEGKVRRKFACVDPGNTLLSVLYFTQNYDLLPPEAIKVAAANLADACHEFGIEIPQLLKVAAKTGMMRKRDPMVNRTTTDDQDWSQRTNLVSIQGGADTGRVSTTLSQTKTAALSELDKGKTPTNQKLDTKGDMPLKGDQKVLAVTKKDVINYAGVDNPPAGAVEVNPKTPREYQRLGLSSDRLVNVTGRKPETRLKKASVQHYALGNKYPIDSFEDVQRAIDYWEQNWVALSPADRHEYAGKTAARADELGLEVPDRLDRYGSIEYAPDIDAHMASRRAVVDKNLGRLYTELQEKRAAMEPDEFAYVLSEIDKTAGLDAFYGSAVQDPYFSTFGGSPKTKTAGWYWQSRIGTYVNSNDLRWLVRNGRPLLHKHFSSDVTDALIKDPFVIFESLPDDSKELIARLANGRYDSLAAN